MSRPSRIAVVVLRLLLLVELAWLGIANPAIQLDGVRALINREPDRMRLHFERAFTPLPGLLWVRNLELNVATPRQFAWAHADSAWAVIDLWRLPNRVLRTRWGRFAGIEVRTRPRVDAWPSYDRMRPFLPGIPGLPAERYDEPGASMAVDSGRPSWMLRFDNVSAGGIRDAQVHVARLAFNGRLHGDVHYRTRATLEIPRMTVAGDVGNLVLNGRAIADRLAVAGTYRIEPYLPREVHGRHALRHVTGSIDIDGWIDSLAALDAYLPAGSGMAIDGSGALSGTLRLERGAVETGSHMVLDRAAVSVNWRRHAIRGGGRVTARLDVAGESRRLVATMENVEVDRAASEVPLVSGGRLELVHRGARLMLAERADDEWVEVRVEHGRIADLARLNGYIPEQLGVDLSSRPAAVSLRWQASKASLAAEIDVDAGDVPATIKGYRVVGDGQARLRVRVDRTSGAIDASGSSVIVDNGGLADDGPRDWSASLTLRSGRVRGVRNDDRQQRFRFGGGRVVLTGSVSHIGFLDVLSGGQHDLAWNGAATLEADVRLAGDHILSDSRLLFASDRLGVDYLDYRAIGKGAVVGWIEGDVDFPRFTARARLEDVRLRMVDHPVDHLYAGELTVTAKGRADRPSRGLEDLSVEVGLSSAEVPDIRVYNRYLPDNSAIRFGSGSGTLTARMLMAGDEGSGRVTLEGSGVEATVRNVPVKGDLSLLVLLNSDQLPRRLFDLSGSILTVSNVSLRNSGAPLAGEDGSGGGDWNGELTVLDGFVEWKRPLVMSGTVEGRMKDSRPLLELFLDERIRFDWVKDILQSGQIRGRAEIGMDEHAVVFNDVDIRSDDFYVGAKVRFGTGENVRGVLHMIHSGLALTVELEDGERDWTLFGARSRFEDYEPFPLPKVP